MKTSVKVSDSRINRNNNVMGYMELCTELVQAQGYDKTFTYENNGSRMTYNEFKTTAYKQNSKDIQCDITLNFITGEATITVDAPEKSKLEEEMEQWEARANDNFGKTLKEIEKASMNYFGCDEDEYGIRSTPLSYPITAYALDGNRKHTAKVITATLEEWDITEDENIKALVNKLNQLAA
jgi:hypothetical protein